MNVARRRHRNHLTYPVKRPIELNPVNRPEAFFNSLLGKTKPSEYTVSGSEPTEHFFFVIFKLLTWRRLSLRNLQRSGRCRVRLPSIFSPSSANSRTRSAIAGSRSSMGNVRANLRSCSIACKGPQSFREFVRSVGGESYLHIAHDIFLRLILKLLHDSLQGILLQNFWVRFWRCHRCGGYVRTLYARCISSSLCGAIRLLRRYRFLGDGDGRKASGDGFQGLLLLCHGENDSA